MRTFVGLAALIASFSIATSSCGGSTSGNGSSTVSTAPQSPPTQSPPSASAGNAVTVGNNVFTPGTIVVSAGQTVNWTWDACTGSAGYGTSDTCVTHGIIFDDGVKSALQSEGTFSRTFLAKGTYPYHCQIHGQAMAGTITVQ